MNFSHKRRISLILLSLLLFTLVTATFSDENESYYTYLPLTLKPEQDYPETPYTRWANAYSETGLNSASDVVETNDGGFAIAGVTASQYYPGWVAKLNQDGSIAWQKAHQTGGSFSKIIVTPDDSIVAAGINRYGDLVIVKHKSDGSLEWIKFFDRGGRLGGIVSSVDNGYMLAGREDYDAWVIKVNHDGSPAWEKGYGSGAYGGGTNEMFNSIFRSGDGGYIVAGQTTSFGAGGWDGWILKLNEDGSIAWQKTYGSSESEYIESIDGTDDGGIITAGWVWHPGGQDGWVMKLNGDGKVVWSKIIGGEDMDNLLSIQQTKDGGLIASGWSQSFGSGQQSWALKLNGAGNILWQRLFGPGPMPSIRQINIGGYVSVGNYMGDAKVLRMDEYGYIPDCEIFKSSMAFIIDHAVSVSDSNETIESFTLSGGGTSYMSDGVAVLNPICPTDEAAFVSCK